jgi:hypothetical protein
LEKFVGGKVKIVQPEPRLGWRQLVIAENQKEYIPVPANHDGEVMETKLALTWKERFQMLWNGTFYLKVRTFGRELQPFRITTTRDSDLPDCRFTFLERVLGWRNRLSEGFHGNR